MAGLANALDAIPMVDDATARDARFPLATRTTNQRVFRLDAGIQQRWSGSAWLDETQRVFNVRGFGAVGDGIADDTAALQSAVNACVAAGGGSVVLPVGNYRVMAPLDLANLGHVRVTIQGAGQGVDTYNTVPTHSDRRHGVA